MHVARIHLKTDCKDRTELIDYCLGRDKKYVAIGWSVVYENGKNYKDYKSYYYGVREYATSCNKKLNHALNVFRDVESGDLFWTRDLSGFYWICRALGKAEPRLERDLDIGSIVPVDAYKVGTEVPGKIKASFNRPRSGIVEYIDDDKIMEYSKFIFNQVSKTELYEIKIIENNILDSLPDFDLEELVISYLQLKRNYYLLSNSIAKGSTTIKVECVLMSRDKQNPVKTVVQVKGGHDKVLDFDDYKDFLNSGYQVYLYAPVVKNESKYENGIRITRNDLKEFYKEYKNVLPESITKWENLYQLH